MSTTLSPYTFWKSNNSVSVNWNSQPAIVNVYPQDAKFIS